jgi:DNA mismatch repair protein MutS
VVRIVTPGTVTDDALLDPRRSTVLMAAAHDGSRWGLAWLELSSGRFHLLECEREDDWRAEAARLAPSELLLAAGLAPPTPCNCVRERPDWQFDPASARRLLCAQFETQDLHGFGAEHLGAALGAAGALLQYVQDTQRAALPHLRSLRVEHAVRRWYSTPPAGATSNSTARCPATTA